MKVNGNYKPRTIPSWKGGYIIISPNEIAKSFVDHYANISRDLHKKSKTRKNRKRKKDDDLQYNKPFSDRELKIAIKQKRIQHQKILFIPR